MGRIGSTGRRAAASALLFLAALSPAFAGGKLTYVEGDVTVTSSGVRTAADFGTPVADGDVVSTGPESAAVITLDAGDELKLRADTVLTVASSTPAGTRLMLGRGGVFARVRKLLGPTRWTLETPSVVAAVRGTQFFTAYGQTIDESPDVWLCVNEGAVAVTVPETGQDVLVEEGKGVNIVGGLSIGRPEAYAWTKDLNWNTDASAGPVADTTDLGGAYADLRAFDYD